MKRTATIQLSLILGALCWLCPDPGAVAVAAGPPAAVSPGTDSELSRIGGGCPTFSWGAVDGARSYELVVYRLDEEGEEAEPVVRETFIGSASSWTPSLEACLEPGESYAWSVRAVGKRRRSDWSRPLLFRVASGPSAAELEQARAVVGEILGEPGDAAGVQPVPPVAARSPAGPGVADQTIGEEGVAPALAIAGPVDDAAVLPVVDMDCRGGRYQNNGDGTVTDCRSGLIWLRDASCDVLDGVNNDGKETLVNAVFNVAQLLSGSCGLTDSSAPEDWRLPTITEWMAMKASAIRQGFTNPCLTDARGNSPWTDGDPFIGVIVGGYWSSSSFTPDPLRAWEMFLDSCGPPSHLLKTFRRGVWPVRDRQ